MASVTKWAGEQVIVRIRSSLRGYKTSIKGGLDTSYTENHAEAD